MAYKFEELGSAILDYVDEWGLGIKLLTPYSEPEYVLSNDGKYYICKGVNNKYADIFVLRENTVKSSIGGIPVTHIGEYAFSYSYFKDFIVPEGITDIGVRAFQRSYNMKNISLPNSLINIGKDAFSECYFENITLPNNLKSIGDCAFCDCDELRSIIIPYSVTSIGDYAFAGCNVLTSVVIGNGVTSIGERAFENCDKLTSVRFAGTVAQWEKIEKGRNWNINIPATEVVCTDGVVSTLVGLYDENNNLVASWYTLVNTYGIDCERDYETPVDVSPSCPSFVLNTYPELSAGKHLIIPGSIQVIGRGAFTNCRQLETVYMLDGVTSIRAEAFYLCDNLLSCHIPNTVVSIDEGAFCACHKLTTITIPDGVTVIGSETFYGCDRLTTITIPNSVTRIGIAAFFATGSALVYYNGTVEEWANISIDSSNELLFKAKILCEQSGTTISIFRINETIYIAEYKMTWEKWVASKYNTHGYFISKNTNRIYSDAQSYVRSITDGIVGSNHTITGAYTISSNGVLIWSGHYWAFDDLDTSSDLDIYLIFSSKGASYYSIRVDNGGIYYGGTLVYTSGDGWVDNAYRSIYIPEDTPLDYSQKVWLDKYFGECIRFEMSEITTGESTGYYCVLGYDWTEFVASAQNKDNIFSIKDGYVTYDGHPVTCEDGSNVPEEINVQIYRKYYYDINVSTHGYLNPGTFTFEPFIDDIYEVWHLEGDIYDPAQSTFWFNFTSAGLQWSGMWIDPEEYQICYCSDFDSSGWHRMFAGTWANDNVRSFTLTDRTPELPAKLINWVLAHTTYSGEWGSGGVLL